MLWSFISIELLYPLTDIVCKIFTLNHLENASFERFKVSFLLSLEYAFAHFIYDLRRVKIGNLRNDSLVALVRMEKRRGDNTTSHFQQRHCDTTWMSGWQSNNRNQCCECEPRIKFSFFYVYTLLVVFPFILTNPHWYFTISPVICVHTTFGFR